MYFASPSLIGLEMLLEVWQAQSFVMQRLRMTGSGNGGVMPYNGSRIITQWVGHLCTVKNGVLHYTPGALHHTENSF